MIVVYGYFVVVYGYFELNQMSSVVVVLCHHGRGVVGEGEEAVCRPAGGHSSSCGSCVLTAFEHTPHSL